MKKQLNVYGKSKTIAEQLEDFNRDTKRVIRKISPFRVKISPRGIENFSEDDKSITYKCGETLWYKAHPEAEPEILAFKGLAILYYNEFITDVELDGVPHRVFYNSLSKKFLVNEIVSYSYKGIVLLRNPVDTQKSEKLTEFFITLNLPKNNRNDTIRNFKERVEKFYKQEELKSQAKNQPKGNLPDPILMEAACWCIGQNPRPRYKRPTLLRAFKKFGKKSHTEGSFITMVRSKWSKILKAYDKMPDDFKKANSEQIYAKTELKVVRKIRKQRTKGN
jgi:hypothetical protein